LNAVVLAKTERIGATTSPSIVRILVVEDNLADARFLEETLSESRDPVFECHCVSDLATAREALAAASFDVVLLDLSLPDGTGMESVRRMREIAPRTPCIVLTGTRDDRLAVQAVAAGAQDYVEKGSEGARLLSRSILYAIERRKAEEAAVGRAQAEEAARQARLLADATRVLNESLDLDRTLQALAGIAISTLGDYGWIDLIEGEVMRRVCYAVRDPRDEDAARAAMAYPPRRDNGTHPAIAAIEHGTPVVIDAREEAARDRMASSPEHRRIIDALSPRAGLAVPLRARGKTIGAVTIVRRTDREAFTPADVVFAEDLASRSALAVENARVHHAAQQAALAREEMIAVVSHDLRNPLSIVGLTLQRLRAMPEVVERAGIASLDRAQKALARTTRLLDDLLEIARIDAGAVVLERVPLAVADFVTEIVDLHRPLAEEKQIALSLALEPNLPPLSMDRERLAQVLANLIGNALKFTPPGKRVVVGAGRIDGFVRFFVEDEGPGIAPDHLHRIFERFYRTPNTNAPGTGLGLAIARGIVAAHGGTIGATSEPGHGARFSFTIPI
jgi:signal transduction histidine kinase/DNA-binding response OmpR family regulator